MKPDRPRRIVYLVPSLDHVCVRQRVDAFVPSLEARGWQVEKWVLPQGILRRALMFRKLRGVDVVVLVRRLMAGPAFTILRWFAKRLVYDFDDAVLYRDSNRQSPFSRSRTRRFTRTMHAADAVIAGNDYLAKLAGRFGGRATVVPTCVDDERLVPPTGQTRPGGQVVIGWIGSASTLMYLESLREALEIVARTYGSSAVLKVVCDRFPDKDLGLRTVRKPWALDEELADLWSFDIGVMPLADDVWTRGKCGFKLLQYMAVGVPVVASPVGVNNEMVIDGETGFLADTPEAWAKALGTLIEDVGMRLAMGRLGRESLNGRYTVRAWRDRYADLIEQAASADGP